MNHTPNWFDWITLLAVFFGPIFALMAQRLLDRIREKNRIRLHIYFTLMSLRATPLHPEHIRALNSIDTVFDRRKDQVVRDTWAKVLAHLGKDADGDSSWNSNLLDLRVDLYQAIGRRVGYDHTVEYIKNKIYQPRYFNEVERDEMQIRQKFARALSEDGLHVVIAQPENCYSKTQNT